MLATPAPVQGHADRGPYMFGLGVIARLANGRNIAVANGLMQHVRNLSEYALD
jgi:hypothetical protein